MASTAEETGQEGLAGKASAQVQEAASTAQEKAADLKEQGKSKLGETLDQRTNQVGGQARKMAQVLRRGGEQLSNTDDAPQAAGLAKGAADRIERLGAYLERTSGHGLVRDVEDMVRRRPSLAAGIGLVTGLAASRFLKASSERRYEGSAQANGVPSQHGYGVSPQSTGGGSTSEPIARERYGTSW